MFKLLKEELKGVLSATVPVIVLIFLMLVMVMGSDWGTISHFGVSSIILIAGITLFMMGVKVGMLPVGESIGAELPQQRSLPLMLGVLFILVLLVVFSEPDLRVMIKVFEDATTGDISGTLLLLVIGAGAGFMMVFSALRILMGFSIKWLLAIGYGIIITLSILVPTDFLAISSDAGWVTTGPLAVPIILGLGTGITSVLADRQSLSDSFGLVGLASMGPIMTMLLLGVLIG